MHILLKLFGEGKELSPLQKCDKALIIFFFTWFTIRLAGRRSFDMKSSFDNVIVILLGAVLSRAVSGASPFLATILCSFVLVLLHSFIAILSLRNQKIKIFFEGRKELLYQNGQFLKENLKRCLTCKEDIFEQVRKLCNKDDLSNIKAVYMEANGE